MSSSFTSLPTINIHSATSSQCTFQSVVFVRALLQSMNQQDFDGVYTGLDKALQLSLGATRNNNNKKSKSGQTATTTRSRSNNNNQKINNQPVSSSLLTNNNNSNHAKNQQPHNKTLRTPVPPSAASSLLGLTSATNNNNHNMNASVSGSPGRAGRNININNTTSAASLNPSGSPLSNLNLLSNGAPTTKNPFALIPEEVVIMDENKKNNNGEETNEASSSDKNATLVHQELFTVFDPDTLRHPQSLPFSSPSASIVTASHPLLSIYSDWLFFCTSRKFSVLQTQHCLILLSEILEALSQVDPASANGSDNNNVLLDSHNNNSGSDSPAQGMNHNNNNISSAKKFSSFHENISSSNKPPSSSPSSRNSPQNLSMMEDLHSLASNFTSVPPEILVETLTTFLARSCQRKKILVIDEEKVRQVALEKQKAAEAAALLALQQSQQLMMMANEKDAHKKGTSNSNKNQNNSASLSLPPNNNNNRSNAMTPVPAGKSQEKNIAMNNTNTNNNDGSLSGRTGTNNNNSIQQQKPQLVDPNPHVKEITVDPVFSASEVRAICAFVSETIFQQWRLVAVMVRAPSGLTLPSTEELIVETLPVALPPLQNEGTLEKIYLDTQARLKAWTDAAQTLESCFNDAMSDRNITIRAEFDRATLVAVRRDKSLREDDARKQMRPDEFKRTVKVLSKVMETEIVMPQLAANLTALNKEDETTAAMAKRIHEQQQEYAAYLREEQMVASLGSASPGSTVSTSGNNTNNARNAKQQQQQQGSPTNKKLSSSLQLQQQQQQQHAANVSDISHLSNIGNDESVQQAPLTLEQRLERLEYAIAQQQMMEKQNSPGSHRKSQQQGATHR